MDNVVQFPEQPAYWAMCAECEGQNWRLEVEGEGDAFDTIVSLWCSHCGSLQEGVFTLDVEIIVELEP